MNPVGLYLEALQLASVVLALTGCGQAPTVPTAAAAKTEINVPAEPGNPEEPGIVAQAPEPTPSPSVSPSPSPSPAPVTVLAYSMTDTRICWKIRDSDPATTSIKLTSVNGYSYLFAADEVTVTQNGSTNPVGYVVLVFTLQQQTQNGRCTITVHYGAIESFVEG